MEHNILSELDKLEKQIQTINISQKTSATKEWAGADVIITKELDKNAKNWLENQPLVISTQNSEPRRLK